MTREEAITELTVHLEHWKRLQEQNLMPTDECANTIDALRMAIEALQREEAEEKGWCHRIRPKNVEVVVRCKDCIHYEKHEAWSACTYWSGDPYEQASVIDEDFCSYGERRKT